MERTTEQPTVTLEQANAAINADRQQRSDACNAAIIAALQEYNCTIVMTPQLSPDNRIIVHSSVVANQNVD